MRYDRDKHQRHSIRLKGYDYSQIGAYFITMCTDNRNCVLGNIVNSEIKLSHSGKIVRKCLIELPNNFPNMSMDEFVIIPNHVHSILCTENDGMGKGLINQTPTGEVDRGNFSSWGLMKNHKQTLGKIIRYFKAKSAKLIRDSGSQEFKWQRNYYDHIIRSEQEVDRIRQYIITNPLQWQLDRENSLSGNYNINHDNYFRGVYDR